MIKEFLKLSVPNILTNLTVPLVSLVDVALMGRMPSTEYILAIGFGTVVFNFLYWAFGFLRMGTTGFVSQAYGSKNHKEIKLTFLRGLVVSITTSFLILLGKDFIFEIVEFFIQTEPNVGMLLFEYFNLRIWAAPATISIYVLTGWLLGMQDSKSALFVALVVNGANALLSYIFVWQLGWYIEGVASGTVIAQYLGLVTGVSILIIKYKFNLNGVVRSDFNRMKKWSSFFRVNSDIFIRTMCLIFTLSIFKVYATNIGSLIGAGNVLLLEFITLSAYIIDGVAFAAESISGKYFGIGKKSLFKRAVKVSFQLGFLLAILISVIFFLFGKSILHLLTDKQNVITVALPYLPWLIIAPIVNVAAFIWDGVYIGCTASKEMRNTMIVATLFIFLPSFYGLKDVFGNHGMWLSLTLFMMARGVIQTILAKRSIFMKLN